LSVEEPRADDPAAWHASALAGWLEPWGAGQLDRLAAGAGLALRMPYLDLALARAALSVPWTEKLRNGFDRYPLRVVAEGLLPEDVRWRRGKAFFQPLLVERFRAAAGPRLDALVADPSPLEPWIAADTLRARIATWRDGSNQDLAGLYRCLTLSRWLARRP
jgi:asparagine synthase (glutamine-hydrolysing)